MARDHLGDLAGFVAVARAGSFTRAAAQLGLSQSALSHSIAALEARLGVVLLTRTTRSVAPTAAGAKLLEEVGPPMEQIDAAVAALGALRARPAGAVRINAASHAIESVLWPALADFLPRYPEIQVELVADDALTDIVAGRFDAGVRLGELVAKDMVSVRIGPDMRMAVVGAPTYFATRKRPLLPGDLTNHICINRRLPTLGGLYAWEFEKGRRALRVRVDGQLVLNSGSLVLQAALAGLGLAYVPEDRVRDALEAGHLVRVLADWCPPFAGYHLYYPTRRQRSGAFALLVEALRVRER